MHFVGMLELTPLCFSIMLFFSPMLSAMEPDEESLQDPKFVAKYGCLIEHFQIKKYFEEKKWDQAMVVIESLEKKGYSDRFLTTAKAKIFFKSIRYRKVLGLFEKSLKEDYKCRLTVPKFKFASYPSLTRDAIIWHYVSQVHELMEDKNLATLAQVKSEELMVKSLGYSQKEQVEEKERIKLIIIRIFSIYSLFQDPLLP